MTDRIANAFKRFGAKHVFVRQDDEDPRYFHAEMDAIDPGDRQYIANAIARVNHLAVEGGGTLLAHNGRKARSDVSFRVVKRRKGKGKGK